MLTGTALKNELVDELNELKLSTMAATLDELYHRPEFLEMDADTYRRADWPAVSGKSQHDTEESFNSCASKWIA